MPTSDSDDFESADEGHNTSDKKERKKRLSSSNYSDNALETNQEPKKESLNSSPALQPKEKEPATNDGWDDFDIDDTETIEASTLPKTKNHIQAKEEPASKDSRSQDMGWDDFDDWGQDDITTDEVDPQPTKPAQPPPQPDKDIKEITDRLAASSTKSSGWGWGGWGVDSLLSTATAGITTITSQVSQGISTVLETGIGIPDPEELARKNAKEGETKPTQTPETSVKEISEEASKQTEESKNASDAPFPFGSIISGVTKFVETTGTKVISGGLDTLETIGKKTMEVLQDGDPGLAKKRAMLGLDSGDKPVLSQVLREAKAKAEEEDKIREEKREAKEVHYENLFDDFEGLVHLEALEMLSRQVNMRIEERMRGLDPEKRQDIKETLQQVADVEKCQSGKLIRMNEVSQEMLTSDERCALIQSRLSWTTYLKIVQELCEMPDEDEEDEEPEGSKADAFHDRLQTATQDLGLKLQFQPLVKQYTDILSWLESEDTSTHKSVYKRSVSALAQATALSVEVYHKAAEMLLVKTRRSTADEADALTQMTVVLTKHISELATLFTEKLNSVPAENKEQNNYITNIFLEAGNSSTYIQNAFQLTLPILQIGAV